MTTQAAPISPSQLRCWRCGRKLANTITPPYDIDCPRCYAKNRQEVATSTA